MSNIAIFASGGGTNAEAIMNYFKDNEQIKVALILSNRQNAYVLERAKNHGVPTSIFSDKELHENPHLIVELLESYKVDFIVLAGFLQFIPCEITERWQGAIINIHPALLPKYGGKGMYGMNIHRAVAASGDRETGITIHFVNERYDDGDIVFQARCEVSPSDSPEDIALKIHKLEQQHFPKVIEQIVLLK